MKKLFVFGLFSIVILLAACKKDSPASATSIDGTYDFKYMSVKSSSSIVGSSGDKMVTTSDYSTINNAGIVIFNKGALTAQAVTYSVDTESMLYVYDGDDLLSSSSYPFTYTLPASNSAGQYKIVGADSIYFPEGGLTGDIDGTGSYQTDASGGHYSFSGNLLTITQNVTKDSTFEDSGETYHMIETATASLVLEKK
jgi:hypothetical protein